MVDRRKSVIDRWDGVVESPNTTTRSLKRIGIRANLEVVPSIVGCNLRVEYITCDYVPRPVPRPPFAPRNNALCCLTDSSQGRHKTLESCSRRVKILQRTDFGSFDKERECPGEVIKLGVIILVELFEVLPSGKIHDARRMYPSKTAAIRSRLKCHDESRCFS